MVLNPLVSLIGRLFAEFYNYTNLRVLSHTYQPTNLNLLAMIINFAEIVLLEIHFIYTDAMTAKARRCGGSQRRAARHNGLV